MEPVRSADGRLTPDAAEFVRYCYRRRTVGWPELYDEMCLVASRGLFRGWGPAELADHGVGFGLFELPALAALASRVVTEEQAGRRAPSGGATIVRMPIPTADDATPAPTEAALEGPSSTTLRALPATG
jgi:hypothetical protein